MVFLGEVYAPCISVKINERESGENYDCYYIPREEGEMRVSVLEAVVRDSPEGEDWSAASLW